MSFADLLLRKIDARMVETASTALAKPQGRDSFEYGRMCGAYLGLHEARTLLLDLLADEDEKDI